MSEFALNLDPINAPAEAQPGIVWRLTGAGDNAADIQLFDNPRMAVNLSVWTDTEALAAVVDRTRHRQFMPRRAERGETMKLPKCL